MLQLQPSYLSASQGKGEQRTETYKGYDEGVAQVLIRVKSSVLDLNSELIQFEKSASVTQRDTKSIYGVPGLASWQVNALRRVVA